MGRKLLYGFAAAGLFYLSVLYRSQALLAVCGAAVLFPLFFVCVLYSIKGKLEIELLFSSYPMEQTGDYLVGIRVKNLSKIYLSRLQAKVQVQNMANGKKQWIKIAGDIPANTETDLMGTMQDLDFGLWKAECQWIHLFDWMNLLYVKKHVTEQKQVMIFPNAYETNMKIGMRTRLFWSDAEQYHPQLGGDDPSEILKFREYQKGDQPNRIHWKLSVKNDSLIVAEMSMPMSCNVVCFLDVDLSSMKKKISRCYWEVVNTLSLELLNQKCAHYLVWQDKMEEELCRIAIRKVEDLTDFWDRISRACLKRGADPEAYTRNFCGETYASWIVWNGELELSCNGTHIQKIHPEQAREKMMELELLL